VDSPQEARSRGTGLACNVPSARSPIRCRRNVARADRDRGAPSTRLRSQHAQASSLDAQLAAMASSNMPSSQPRHEIQRRHHVSPSARAAAEDPCRRQEARIVRDRKRVAPRRVVLPTCVPLLVDCGLRRANKFPTMLVLTGKTRPISMAQAGTGTTCRPIHGGHHAGRGERQPHKPRNG